MMICLIDRKERKMRNVIERIPFILLIIGTLGLLLNEFVFDWGSIATLIFAILNVIGLLVLLLTYRMWTKER